MLTQNQNSEIFAGLVIDNRYEVSEIIDHSEYTILTRATDTELENENILIKFFNFTDGSILNDLERFRAEVIITRKLSHPNIGGVYDLGRYSENYFYITLQDVPGVSLFDYIISNRKNKISFPVIMKILFQSLEALKETHKKKVVHRDITPKNIIVNVNNDKLQSLYLVNFGFGSFLDKNMGLTKTGEIIPGDPTYMPPEKIRGEILDARADIFSLGVVMHELIAGNFIENDRDRIPLNALTLINNLPDLSDIRLDIPIWFKNIILKMVEPQKSKRFNSVEEIQGILLEKVWGDPVLSKKIQKFDFAENINIKNLFYNTFIILFLLFCIKFNSQIKHYMFGTPLPAEAKSIQSQKLFMAALSGDESELFKLINSDSNLNISDSRGTPLIHLAVNKEELSVVYTILRHSPNLASKLDQNSQTPLHRAVLKNNLELVNLILNNGRYDLGTKDSNNKTALDYARENSYSEIIKALELHT